MNPSNAKESKCPTCSTGKVMTGRHAEFQAKNKRGVKVCVDCIIRESYQNIDA